MAARTRQLGTQQLPNDCCSLSRLPAYLYSEIEGFYGRTYLATARCLDQLLQIARDEEVGSQRIEDGKEEEEEDAENRYEASNLKKPHPQLHPKKEEELWARKALLKERCAILKARKRTLRPACLQAYKVLVVGVTIALLLLHGLAFEPHCLPCGHFKEAISTEPNSTFLDLLNSKTSKTSSSANSCLVKSFPNFSTPISDQLPPCTAPCTPETLTTWKVLLTTSLALYSLLLTTLTLHCSPPSPGSSLTVIISLLALLTWSSAFDLLSDYSRQMLFTYRTPGSGYTLLSLHSSPYAMLAVTTLYGLLLLHYLLQEHRQASLDIPQTDPWIGWALAHQEQQMWEATLARAAAADKDDLHGSNSTISSSSKSINLFADDLADSEAKAQTVVIKEEGRRGRPFCDFFSGEEPEESWV